MNIDPKTPINLELTLNEVEGILAGLGELPTKRKNLYSNHYNKVH